ncbi:DNA-binding transcriptional LysR family regulator [Duganella sp. 1411]|uniref:LysR family transcriptional regulator n=1 Tax=Duganella sp. 1411 TaxID=2806572 RepID=UPI001AE3B320|nr:LysR family transcriptional regulator [Duganella sp. 1411]MBP1205272.1 DNA-binding transcriptional LysR family regulator [Duganella sp. 1411]
MQRAFEDVMLGSIELLLSVAELGSFTLAANSAGISPAAVSKAVMRLEKRLGLQIFVRSTRKMRLTDAGERYVDGCRNALTLLREAEQSATGAQVVPTGRLRFSLPTPYAHWRVLPLIAAFRRLYPQVKINIHISNQSVSLTSEQFDIAIRGNTPADSGMVARKIEDAELVIVASPEYLRAAPPLRTPADLAHHQCIQFLLPRTGKNSLWSYVEDGVVREYEVAGDIVCEEEYLGGLALARGGAGVYQMYRFAVEDDLKAGRLVELLQEYGGATRPFYLIFPRTPVQPARLRVFIDFLMDKLGA